VSLPEPLGPKNLWVRAKGSIGVRKGEITLTAADFKEEKAIVILEITIYNTSLMCNLKISSVYIKYSLLILRNRISN
jgi:hypothetical protein